MEVCKAGSKRETRPLCMIYSIRKRYEMLIRGQIERMLVWLKVNVVLETKIYSIYFESSKKGDSRMKWLYIFRMHSI